jgi:prophage regulatory protein
MAGQRQVDGRWGRREIIWAIHHEKGRPIMKPVERALREAQHKSFDDLPGTGFIRAAQLIPHVVPFSQATLWRKTQIGEFPRPVKLSERVTAWRVSDVRAWLEAQA